MRSTIPLLAVFAPAVLAQAEASCSGLHFVYARATGEPDEKAGKWSKGYGAAGYSLFTNITTYVPGSTGYPVHYPAGMGTENQGSADMVKHLKEKAAACPQQKYALGGHSQGSFAVVDAVPKLPKDILERVVAVTMFGGKPCNQQVVDRCVSYCNQGDPVCASRPCSVAPKVRLAERDIFAKMPDCAQAASMKTCGLGSGSHLGYNADGTYVRAAACFVAAQYTKRSAGGT